MSEFSNLDAKAKAFVIAIGATLRRNREQRGWSHEDLSAGLVSYQTAGPVGYSSQSATDLMRNLILWSSARVEGD